MPTQQCLKQKHFMHGRAWDKYPFHFQLGHGSSSGAKNGWVYSPSFIITSLNPPLNPLLDLSRASWVRQNQEDIYSIACENIRFSSLFASGDVSRVSFRFVPPRETSPAAKSEEKRMFSQAIYSKALRYHPPSSTLLALIGASAFAFNKCPHKPDIFWKLNSSRLLLISFKKSKY